MNRIKPAYIGVMLLFSCGAAHAIPYDIGTLNATPYGSGAKTVTGTPSFEDRYIFDLTGTSPWAVGIGLSNIPLAFPGLPPLFDISGLNLGVYNSASAPILDSDANPLSFIGILSPGTDYYMKITGTPTGSNGGMYVLGAVAAAIPTPETWTLVTAGLGLLGWRHTRRRATHKASGDFAAA
ncbi:MAG: FxDxF family PEP-CTERM protein [Gammaproteobacteria bacterium]|nr:FxDxF family PEP-CTERM protein [Gammaproteobacteria bacterium]